MTFLIKRLHSKLVKLKKLKILFRGHMLLVTLLEKKLLERFTKKIAENYSNSV